MRPSVVVIQSPSHAGADDARFALRELQRQWSADTRVLVGMGWREALDVLPPDLSGPVLVLRGVMLTLESRCLERLALALEQGADVALACDSSAPAPMPAPSYATVRGMERFVDAHAPSLHDAGADGQAAVELCTLQGLVRRRDGQARVFKVSGAWAHDAANYFGSDRAEAVPLLPAGLTSLLDVGGGEGAFLAAAKAAHPQLRTTLVELTADASRVARSRPGVDAVWSGNFLDWQTEQRFDCVSFLDVLEHIVDPEQALRRACMLLSPAGSVLLSIPNVGHASVVADLIEGRWDWAPVGIHCYSHVRFFTRNTIEQMLQRVGLQPSLWHEVRVPCPPHWLERWGSPGLQLDPTSLEVYAYLVRAERSRP